MTRRALLLLSAVLLLTLLSACESLNYYRQAVSGQLGILGQREAIADLLEDSQTPAALREQLQQVEAIREFAGSSLQLPLGRQFSTYVDLHRPYVVWNVFAAPPLSLELKRWCYPVAGCVSYRGYFAEQDARQYARQLREEGFDVYVGGVTAYSTLGWFADPLLNTVINRRPDQLAALIFHELAHQLVYIKGDTVFNESFATAVEQIGSQRWISHTMSNAEGSELLAQTELEKKYRSQFVQLVQDAVSQLQTLYESTASDTEKLAGKVRLTEQLRADYRQLKQQWQGYAAYDGWFSGELNNAQLGTVSAYNELVPAFMQLYQSCSQQLDCFYAEVRQLAALQQPQREARIKQLQAVQP